MCTELSLRCSELCDMVRSRFNSMCLQRCTYLGCNEGYLSDCLPFSSVHSDLWQQGIFTLGTPSHSVSQEFLKYSDQSIWHQETRRDQHHLNHLHSPNSDARFELQQLVWIMSTYQTASHNWLVKCL